MLNIAYIFPGQGAQYIGMGADFYYMYPKSREVFEQANQILGFDLANLIFKGPFEELTRTANCQIAIFTVSIACLRALEQAFQQMTPHFAAGLSLGEYAALIAAGALSFEDGLKLVNIRAQHMEQASLKNPGGMVSIIGLPIDVVEKVAKESCVEVANLNCPGQVVVSGSQACLEKAKEQAYALGAKKTISLNVGGAFHSSFMEPARQELLKALEKVAIKPTQMPVISNVTARPEETPEQIKENLARQVVSRTLWEDSVRFMESQGAGDFLEIGPGKVLRALIRKINPDLKVHNIETTEDLKRLKEEHLS